MAVIVHAVQGLPRTAGTTVFVLELAAEQAKAGHDVRVCYFEPVDCEGVQGVKIQKIESPEEIGDDVDILHQHALWSPTAVKTMRWCCRRKIPYIVSLHGCLMPRVFEHGWLKKQVFYYVFLKGLLKSAAAIHTTGAGETSVARALGLGANTVELPLGCHIPELDISCARRKQFLFLGRIGEEKGLLTLLEAWREMARGEWELVIAGPDWKGYKKVLDEKIRREAIDGVVFTGDAGAEMKDRLYRAASYFVLASPMENFSLVVLDALAYGVPVICTTGTPWEVIEKERCGWRVAPDSVQALREAMESARALSEEKRREASARARAVAAQYSWPVIARKMLAAYERCRGMGVGLGRRSRCRGRCRG